jgi:hypothetical protein
MTYRAGGVGAVMGFGVGGAELELELELELSCSSKTFKLFSISSIFLRVSPSTSLKLSVVSSTFVFTLPISYSNLALKSLLILLDFSWS